MNILVPQILEIHASCVDKSGETGGLGGREERKEDERKEEGRKKVSETKPKNPNPGQPCSLNISHKQSRLSHSQTTNFSRGAKTATDVYSIFKPTYLPNMCCGGCLTGCQTPPTRLEKENREARSRWREAWRTDKRVKADLALYCCRFLSYRKISPPRWKRCATFV